MAKGPDPVAQLHILRVWATSFSPDELHWTYADAKAEVRRILGLVTGEWAPTAEDVDELRQLVASLKIAADHLLKANHAQSAKIEHIRALVMGDPPGMLAWRAIRAILDVTDRETP